MATKNIVPNADGEGQLGTSSKSWAQGHIDLITGTIATAAQGNITSVGTLTALTLSGNIAIPNDGTIGSAGTADGIKINSSGKIGINSSSTSLVYPLEVHGGNGDAIIFKDTTNSVTTWLGAFGGAAVAGALTAGDDFALYAGNAERLRISSTGNVGINVTPASTRTLLVKGQGTSSSTAAFQVNDGNNADILVITDDKNATFSGNIAFTGSASNLNFSADQDGSITMSQRNDGGRNLDIGAGGAGSGGGTNSNGGNLTLRSGGTKGTGTSTMHFRTSVAGNGYGLSTEQMRIDSVGDVNITNNLFIGSGKALYVGGTSAANGLDKYEEGGTWTVSLPNGGTIGSIVSSRYTIIGNMCHFSFYLNNISSIPNNSSDFYISLPVTPDTTGSDYVGANIAYSDTFDVSSWLPIIHDQAQYLYFHYNDGTSGNPIPNSVATGLTSIIMSGWYYV